MDTDTNGDSGGRGIAFGATVHSFAEEYASGDPVTPSNADEEAVKRVIDGLDGTVTVEEDTVLPLEVAGDEITLSGVADLVHVTETEVEVIDWKTDQTRRAHEEYRKQLSVYYYVFDEVYPEREVRPIVFYTAEGASVEIEPLSLAEFKSVVEEYRAVE